MKLFLVRHGESVGNAEGRLQGHFDSPLSDQGREQAQALARRLGCDIREPAALYTSDLSRATETAGIIGARMEVPLVLDRRLREYDFGVLNGIVWSEAESLYPSFWNSFQQGSGPVPIPEEEGRWAFRKRLASALADIRGRHGGEDRVIVVTHGGCLSALVAEVLGMEPGWPRPFWFDNASLSIVEYPSRGPVITCLNDVCHLRQAE